MSLPAHIGSKPFKSARSISSALGNREYLRENMEGLVVNGTFLHRIYDVRAELWQVFIGTDLMAVSV